MCWSPLHNVKCVIVTRRQSQTYADEDTLIASVSGKALRRVFKYSWNKCSLNYHWMIRDLKGTFPIFVLSGYSYIVKTLGTYNSWGVRICLCSVIRCHGIRYFKLFNDFVNYFWIYETHSTLYYSAELAVKSPHRPVVIEVPISTLGAGRVVSLVGRVWIFRVFSRLFLSFRSLAPFNSMGFGFVPYFVIHCYVIDLWKRF